jgi:hypothetical protein
MESHGGVILTGKTEEHGERPVPVPPCPPQIPHGLTRARHRASAERGPVTVLLSHGVAYGRLTLYKIPGSTEEVMRYGGLVLNIEV